LLLFRKSLVVGMKRELIHAEELEGRNKRRKEDLTRLLNSHVGLQCTAID
jgi:hypothetical protein